MQKIGSILLALVKTSSYPKGMLFSFIVIVRLRVLYQIASKGESEQKKHRSPDYILVKLTRPISFQLFTPSTVAGYVTHKAASVARKTLGISIDSTPGTF